MSTQLRTRSIPLRLSNKSDQKGRLSFPVRIGLGAIIPIALVVVWESLTREAGSIYFPPPSTIFSRAVELWFSGPAPFFLTEAVFNDIVPSLTRMLAGWSLAAAIGIALGVLIGRSRQISWATSPILNFLRSTPGPALIPIFLILLGTDSTMRVTLIAFGCIWPILLNTIEGVRSVEPTQLETGRAFGLPARARVWKIIIPAAMPKVFAGLSVALAIALVLMVVSELTVATDGIGYQIQRAQQTFMLADLWAGILLVGLLGYLLTMVFTLVERRGLAWYRGAQRHEN